MGGLSYRTASLDDFDRLFELVEHFMAASDYQRILGAPDRALTRAYVEAILEVGVIFVYEVDGTIEGMLAAAVLKHPATGLRFAEEQAWWVEPAHRLGGAGLGLLKLFHEWARNNDAVVCKMIAPARSTVSAFYESIGYREAETAYHMRL